MNVQDHRVIFMVITLDDDSELFDVLGLNSYPSLVYLPENHPLSEVGEDGVSENQITGEERELLSLVLQEWMLDFKDLLTSSSLRTLTPSSLF